MLTNRLLLAEEIDIYTFKQFEQDYVSLPTMKTMQEELKGYDIVDLAYLKDNILALREYMTDSKDCALDLVEREWHFAFLAGWWYVACLAMTDCQLVYTN